MPEYMNEENKAETFWQNLETKVDSLEEAKQALQEVDGGEGGGPVDKW